MMQQQQQQQFSNFPVDFMDKQRAATMGPTTATYGGAMMNFDYAATSSMTMNNNNNNKMMMQQPHYQALHKPVIHVVLQSSSSSQSSQRSSPCQERPCYLVPNHFHAKQANFVTIKTSIDAALKSLQENSKYLDCIDYLFSSSDCQYRMRYTNGSDFREIHINCYWDSNANDHIIEMNRVRGDGLSPSTSEFYETVRKAVLGEQYTAPQVAPGRRPMMAGPPPLLMKKPTLTASQAPVLPAVSEESFMKGVKPIFAMAEDNFYEPRLEAAKALCDIAKRDIKLVSQPECESSVVRALNALLMDEFEDVRQFAVIACARFAALSASYKSALSKMNAVHVLVSLVLKAPVNEQVAYETAQMRRKACVALTEMMAEEPESIRACLAEHDVHDMATLQQRCHHIPYSLVADLELCF